MTSGTDRHALAGVDDWPARRPAVGVTRADGVLETRGPVDERSALASVTKLLSALSVLVAVEEGTLGLEEPAGPAGSTVAHLLAHASGLGPEGGVARPPGERRIYSNAGFEVVGRLLEERSGIPYEIYVSDAVLRPLGMSSTTAEGSPASGALGTVADLLTLGRELLAPTLVSPSTLARATSPAFPGLAGVLPGFGPRAPNDWGLGFELRNGKSPHWTGSANSASTFGHFGHSGSFLWVDPEAGLACACLAGLDFGPWAATAWPALADAVLGAYRPAASPPRLASTPPPPRWHMDLGLAAGELEASFRADVEAGLLRSPKELASKWFYDEPGSKLFDAITRLPEYYPTRRERAILEARAETIASMTRATTVVELGSGTSEKTRILLDALFAAGTLRRFVPFDVSEETLAAAAEALASEYRGVEVHAVVGDLERHLGLIPEGGARLVVFLGSTIGNLSPPRRHRFLTALANQLRRGDALLLGTDLVKDVGRLERAYNDAAGITAAFNRNLLDRLNRELGADFSLRAFEHVARFVPDGEWVEMALRSLADQEVRVAGLGISVAFAAGEEMRTEISTKFRREGVEAELAAAGLALERWWTDPDGDFALSLSVPAGA